MITSFFKPKAKSKAKTASPGSESTQSTSDSTVGSSAATSKRSIDDDDDDSSHNTNDEAPNSSKRTKHDEGSKNIGSINSSNREKAPSKAATDLLEHLERHGGMEVDPSTGVGLTWRSALWRWFTTMPTFSNLAEFVAAERKAHVIYPSPSNTWTALNACPLQSVKVVIVGQDPYHGPNQAHGLAFSVERGQAIPPSLRNMYKELVNDPAVPEFVSMPKHGNLLRWAQQGVLLLNTVLTVRSGLPNSHAKKGWEAVTDQILRHAATKKTPVVFLLWGKPAAAKAQFVPASAAAMMRHTIICTSHPSPLGATKTSSPFLGSRCFSRCNDALVELGLEPIDWRVDGPLSGAETIEG